MNTGSSTSYIKRASKTTRASNGIDSSSPQQVDGRDNVTTLIRDAVIVGADGSFEMAASELAPTFPPGVTAYRRYF